jgi:hypothetical protein
VKPSDLLWGGAPAAPRKQAAVSVVISESSESNGQPASATSGLEVTSAVGASHGFLREAVILQTAEAYLVNPAGQKKRVVVLIDGGSDRSFIRKEVAEELNITSTGQECLTVHSFGGASRKHTSRRLPITLQSLQGDQVQLEVYEVLQVCGQVSVWPAAKFEEFLTAGARRSWDEFASCGQAAAVDVLIGADFC